jgi:hypothetical protein
MSLCFSFTRPSEMIGRAIFLAAVCVFSCSASAGLYRVIGVADGDTITVLDDNERMVKCRLYGIDAPEKAQAYGAQSKASLSEMTFRRIAEIGFTGRDRYGRRSVKSRSMDWTSTGACSAQGRGYDNEHQRGLGHARNPHACLIFAFHSSNSFGVSDTPQVDLYASVY